MKHINFSCNQFSYLSDEVRQAMDGSNLILENHKPLSFGVDYKIMAEIENVRNLVADSLKLSAREIFFSHGNQNSTTEIINNAILFLKVETIITSIFENKQKLEYLESLQSTGKIKLIYVQTSKYGEIDLVDLKEKLSQNKTKTLISLSHANLYTGILLPIKELLSICKTHHIYFHLDINLTIGRYQINFQELKPDYISFDCSLLHGPVGVGIQIINDKIEVDKQGYQHITNHFRICENMNLAQIMGFHQAYSHSQNYLEDNKLKINKLRQYFIAKVNSVSHIIDLTSEFKKHGLINLIPLYIDKNNLGHYLIEKLDLKGIFVQNIAYPIEMHPNHQFLSIAINEDITEADVDYFFEILENH